MSTQSLAPTRVEENSSNQTPLLRISVVVATISVIVINLLATLVPFNGQTPEQISEQYKSYFVPAGYVFLIWNVIYVGILAYAIYQAYNPSGATPLLRRISGWHIVGCIANSLWIFAWHWEQLGLSVLLMFVLLGSLIGIYVCMAQVGWGRGQRTHGQTWSIFVPFSIYLGWISVATIPNISSFLLAHGWQGGGMDGPSWALLLLVIAAVLGIFFGYGRSNLAYALVVVWAFVGIGVEQAAPPLVAYPAYGLAAGVLVAALLGVRQRNKA
jgi:translocator protein